MRLTDCEIEYNTLVGGYHVSIDLDDVTTDEGIFLEDTFKRNPNISLNEFFRKLEKLESYTKAKESLERYAKESLERYNERYCKASRYVSYDRKEREKLVPKKVIFNPPATIVFWKDGTKTIIKCREDDIFDEEIGLAMAIAQKFAGDRSKFKKMVKKASRPQEKHTL